MSRIRTISPLLVAFGLSACATTGSRTLAAAASCETSVGSIDSAAGRAWRRDHGWRFPDEAAAIAAYEAIAKTPRPSAWPDWFEPRETSLPVGMRFQMAIGQSQTPDMPGTYGTFDRIGSVEDVRTFLAVRQAWKPDVDRVVTYEVTAPLAVKVGPIGPQVDGATCRLLPGRFSQLEIQVPRERRMQHLKVIEVRPIR